MTALVLSAASPVLIACSDASPPGDVEQTGTLNAALLTAAADGATYQFPAGTLLILSKPGYREEVALDGSETVLSIRVPVGDLQVELQYPNGTPQLRRTIGGATTLVDATWTDFQPLIVPIGSNLFTDLTLHFQVTGLGDVTFDMGTLNVALEVQRNSTAQPAQFIETGTYIHSFQLFGSTATAGAQAYFAQGQGDSHVHTFDFNFAGPWAQANAEMICAPVRLDQFSTTDGESGFTRATNILINQIGTACIIDAGVSDQFFFNAAVSGPAPIDLQPILPSGNYRFFVSVGGFVGDVYDGQTFRQSTLESAKSINGGVIAHQIFDLAAGAETLYQEGFLSGTMRLVP